MTRWDTRRAGRKRGEGHLRPQPRHGLLSLADRHLGATEDSLGLRGSCARRPLRRLWRRGASSLRPAGRAKRVSRSRRRDARRRPEAGRSWPPYLPAPAGAPRLLRARRRGYRCSSRAVTRSSRLFCFAAQRGSERGTAAVCRSIASIRSPVWLDAARQGNAGTPALVSAYCEADHAGVTGRGSRRALIDVWNRAGVPARFGQQQHQLAGGVDVCWGSTVVFSC